MTSTPPTADLTSPVLRRSLTDDVHQRLTAMIMDHHIAPDAKVSIDELARVLQVSQTPVREALARLEASGLVRKEPARGYFTTPLISRQQLEELFEFRRQLEPWAARAAAAQVDDEGRGRLRDEMRLAGDLPRGSDYESYKSLAAHDARFHGIVFDLAGNQFMAEAFAGTRCHLHIFRLHYGQDFASPATDEHHRVVEAITQGDADAAGAAMLAHIDASYSRLESAAH